MFHSIIVPNRNRAKHLEWCVASIQRSAAACDSRDWELVIVDNSRTALPESTQDGHVRVVADPQDGAIYNKAKALNIGIDCSEGSILTFVDADAIVGPDFMRGARVMESHSLHRYCYRVRKIGHVAFDRLLSNERELLFFGFYEWLPLAYEAYGRWDTNVRNANDQRRLLQPWGNSQFSISREHLGDLRYDETYEGRGYEDLDMNMRLWAKFGKSYRGGIATLGCEAMVHVDTPEPDEAWSDPAAKSRSLAHYRRKMADTLRTVAA